jgi:hypothetical protein
MFFGREKGTRKMDKGKNCGWCATPSELPTRSWNKERANDFKQKNEKPRNEECKREDTK